MTLYALLLFSGLRRYIDKCVGDARQMSDHRGRSSVNFGGGKTFLPENVCMKNYTNCPDITRCLPEKFFSPEFLGATALHTPCGGRSN